MATEIIKVPDIGGAESVDVIEVSVAVGDTIELEDTLIVLETDKASMDIPASAAGKIVSVSVNEGDKVSEGDVIVEVEVEGSGSSSESGSSDSSNTSSTDSSKSSGSANNSDSSDGSAGSEESVSVPDLGGADNVDVIELCVAPGDTVEEGDSLIVLETDKASLDVPSPVSGEVVSLAVSDGDKVSQGDALAVIRTAGGASSSSSSSDTESASQPESAPSESGGEQPMIIPDLGGSENVDVIEICVAEGDEVAEGDSLIVLETDKASLDVPASASGKVVSLTVKEGDKVSSGDSIGTLAIAGQAASAAPQKSESASTSKPAPAAKASAPAAKPASAPVTNNAEPDTSGSNVYAGPAVRKLARQLGVNLDKVKGSGPRKRLTKDDLRSYVKNIVKQAEQGGGASTGSGIPAIPAVDFSQFGDIELVKMSKIKKLTAENMVRNWLNVPHVTQWDDADITELEAFRKGLKAEAEKRGSKLTPLPFLLKAAAAALRAEPSFNVSMHHDGEHIVQKDYVHIGVAVDSPMGLVVPVIRDVDKKGLWELADEFVELVNKARNGKLMPKDMQGGCFTISSLGAMGGTGFTPIVNAPEVAILGVSKADIKPVWNGSDFEPRNLLPLSLSYDHRAINGADAGRFFTFLTSVLSDVRRLLL